MDRVPNSDDEKKGDEVLRRLLKTPPEPKSGKGAKKKEFPDGNQKPTRKQPSR